MLSALLAAATISPSRPVPPARREPPAWHHRLSWQARTAWVARGPKGSYVLHAPDRTRVIVPQRFQVHTASVLFDALFAMAQADLEKDSVSAITDAAFEHGRPIRCRCFIAGKEWPFVWTRDLSYSTDLGLWRFDPARARASLLFKLSPVRAQGIPVGAYVMQDTGSGGSWPISTDRVVWFLGARHLLDDPGFAATVYAALTATLAQDRRYTFDPRAGLYRGETSFLDWRSQSYPEWTASTVVFIAQSFALSTNVLHYQALRLASALARRHGDVAGARTYARQAGSLKAAINARFWSERNGLYMSYIGGRIAPAPFDAYDLLGIDLAVTSGVADPARARRALERYPAWPAGSPVIWPERRDEPIYHNRAIWPFVSEYTLRAARRIDDPNLIAHELRSLVRGAALEASNMENFSLRDQSTRVPGPLGGPVVDSRRQLWSVAGYLDMVMRGVFGLEDGGRIEPKLPTSLVPMLFGSRKEISLDLDGRQIVLRRPARLRGDLLLAGSTRRAGAVTRVELVGRQVAAAPLRLHAPSDLPPTPSAPVVSPDGREWRITDTPARGELYLDGRRLGRIAQHRSVPRDGGIECFSVTALGEHGLQSLHGPETCVGRAATLLGAWPRSWTAPKSGTYVTWLEYDNDHGPISTGITAAVKRLRIRCRGAAAQTAPIVMPQSLGWQASTDWLFHARAGARCTFSLAQGANMSDLARFALYTGGAGGAGGPVNSAHIAALNVAPLAAGRGSP
jgi:hypothetical protein